MSELEKEVNIRILVAKILNKRKAGSRQEVWGGGMVVSGEWIDQIYRIEIKMQ